MEFLKCIAERIYIQILIVLVIRNLYLRRIGILQDLSYWADYRLANKYSVCVYVTSSNPIKWSVDWK